MSMEKRKWSSVDRLEDNYLLGAELRAAPSNLSSLRSLSVSTPTIFQLQQNNNEGNHFKHPGSTDDSPSSDEGDSARNYNVHTPLVHTKALGRQKKFARHFKKDDQLVDYFSCALAVDILLQGFLYITENHFAFYSNVFGRVSKILIPVCTITRITKNKTALIFPNAIRVYTSTEKHVFASLLSRDSTYELMHKVWSISKLKNLKGLKKTASSKSKTYAGLSVEIPEKHVKFPYESPGNTAVLEESSDPDPEASPVLNSRPALALVNDNKLTAVRKASDRNQLTEEVIARSNFNARNNINPIPPSPQETLSRAHPPTVISTREATESARKSAIIKVSDKTIITLSVVTIIILVFSAVNLYTRVDDIAQDIQDQMTIHEKKNLELNDNEQLINWQKLVHGNSADNIIHHIDQNIEKIHAAYQSLEACYVDLTRKMGVTENPDVYTTQASKT